MTRALIVVDVQNDFCEGGALAVAGGSDVARAIAEHLRATRYDLVVTSQDWHSSEGTNGGHFAANPDYQNSWPAHCIAGSPGAALHDAIRAALDSLNGTPVIAVHKGWGEPAYSAFDGEVVHSGVDLADVLTSAGVTELYIAGIATDYCVAATARGARRLGFDPVVLGDLTASVNPDKDAALTDLTDDALLVARSEQVPS